MRSTYGLPGSCASPPKPMQGQAFGCRSACCQTECAIQMGASVRSVDAGTEKLASEVKWLNRAELLDLDVVNVDD